MIRKIKVMKLLYKTVDFLGLITMKNQDQITFCKVLPDGPILKFSGLL